MNRRLKSSSLNISNLILDLELTIKSAKFIDSNHGGEDEPQRCSVELEVNEEGGRERKDPESFRRSLSCPCKERGKFRPCFQSRHEIGSLAGLSKFASLYRIRRMESRWIMFKQ